jgi:hypothetical protein
MSAPPIQQVHYFVCSWNEVTVLLQITTFAAAGVDAMRSLSVAVRGHGKER